jgi:hypothetical protein
MITNPGVLYDTPPLHEMYSLSNIKLTLTVKREYKCYLLSQPTYLHNFHDGFRSRDPCLYTKKDAATSELHSPSLSILAISIWQIFPCSEVLLANREQAHLEKKKVKNALLL